MKVKELKRLLSYFSEEVDVVIGSDLGLLKIENVKGEPSPNTGQFFVTIETLNTKGE